MIYFFPEYVFSPTSTFKSIIGDLITINTAVSYLLIALSIWRIVILVNYLQEVQGFSAWKGIFSVAIAYLVWGLIILTIATLFRIAWGIPTVI